MRTESLIVGALLCGLLGTVAWAGGGEGAETFSAPTARYGLSVTTVGEEIYLFGGSDYVHTYNDLWRWDCGAKTWVEVAAVNPPPARYYHGAAPSGGMLYVGYGLSAMGMTLGDLWAYDPAANAWSQRSVIGGPVPHYLGSMGGLADGRILVTGGYDSGGDALLDAYLIDPAASSGDIFSAQHIESIYPPRYGAVVGSAPCGAPVVIGGWEVPAKGGGPTASIIMWTPDPEPWGHWIEMTPQGDPVLARALAAGAQWVDRGKRGKADWGDVIIIIGGESLDKASQTAEVQYYDIAANTWSYGPPLELALSSLGAAVIPPACAPDADGVQVLVFGGLTEDGVSGETVVHDTGAEVTSGGSLVVTAAAHAGGLGTTMWVTDLEFFNGGAVTATCTVDLLQRNRDNSTRPSMSFELGPERALRLPDVMFDRFGVEGTGAFLVRYDGGELQLTSRTYNLLGDANEQGLPAGATFGQFIPGVLRDEALTDGDEARLIQLASSADPDTGFRTNIGFVNLSAVDINVEVDLYRGDGTLLGTVEAELLPFEYDQITGIYDRVTTEDVGDGYAIVRTTTEGAAFMTYASVVDNPTGDPTYVAPQQPVGAGGGVVAAAAQAPGVGGTQWRTDLVLHNPTAQAVSGGAFLLPRDQANTDPLLKVVTVPAGQSMAVSEVLDEYFGFDSGTAALRFGNALGNLLITSRTYNLLGQGNSLGYPAGATFGQFIPALPMARVSSFGDQVLLMQLTRSADPDSGFRANIGVLNAGDEVIEVEVELHRADGALLGTVRTELDAWESRQWTDIFGRVTSGDVPDGYAFVRTTTDGGSFVAYASVVDNITGDPIYIPGM